MPPDVVVPETVAGNARPLTLIVLQPNPLLVVQVRALDAPEHEPIASAVGDAAPAVALPVIVFAACVARIVSGIVPAPATVPEKVGLAIVGEVPRTMLPVPVTELESVTPP